NIFQPDQHRGTGIILLVKIWNTGAESVVIEWKLNVIPVPHEEIKADFYHIVSPIKLRGNEPKDRNSFAPGDDLSAKLRRSPVTTEPAHGALLFIAQLPLDTVKLKTTRFELIATDIYGQEFKTSKSVKEFQVPERKSDVRP